MRSPTAGVTVLVTTHYLDEAERCHRVALIHAGRLATIGTVPEVKQVFASRPILEIRAVRPVEVMNGAGRDAGGREDVALRHRGSCGAQVADALARRRAGPPGRSGPRDHGHRHGGALPRRRLSRRRGPGGAHDADGARARRRAEGGTADRAGPPDADGPDLRAGVLPAGVRLRAELRRPRHRAGRRGPRRLVGEPGTGVGVRQLRLLHPCRRRARSARRGADAGPQPGARPARDPRAVRPRRCTPAAARPSR